MDDEEIIYDEARVPSYRLPDPLITLSGEKVVTEEQWEDRRREILALFETHIYGVTPSEEIDASWQEPLGEDREVFEGKGLRRQVRLWFRRGGKSCKIDVLIYYPLIYSGPAPFFLGLNFQGNHTVQADPEIIVTDAWVDDGYPGVQNHQASSGGRGGEESSWPVEKILTRGYGLATAYYGDMDPDFDDGFQNGVHPLFFRAGQDRPGPEEWGAIGAWAWGLSRIMDFLDEDERVDSARVAVMGHSRLGKTALWAGAQDSRFGLVISNNSGCGGAALFRRRFGETAAAINTRFPHWFCGRFHEYNHQEDRLPVDQHMLVSLVAPRPVYIASAAEDLWADPRGEFLSAYHAAPVYRLLGTDGLAANEMPPLEEAVLSKIGYHIRHGKHDVTDFDWDCFLNFADLHF